MADTIVECFTGPAKVVGTWIAEKIYHQFNYLWCFTSIINSLKDESNKLDDALEGLEGQVQSGRYNLQEPVPEVQTWLTESKEIKVEINGILNEATNVESGVSKLGARLSLSKRAKEMTDRTKEHRGQYKLDSIFQPRPPPATLTVPGGKTYEFESRKKIEKDIMTTLRCGDVNLIGIYGMGGLGKTTMAQKIRNRVLNENVFQEVAMVVVSQQADKSKIQVEIGAELKLKLQEEISQSARVQKLHARLSGTKRTLIILDDVWEGFELENLGIPCDSKWCTILITSRNSDALTAMRCKVENKFGMEILSEEDAWYLFRESTGIKEDDDELISLAKEVMKECGGLPIALIIVGRLLNDEKKASIWKDILGQLRQPAMHDLELLPGLYKPLTLSYDFLGSKQAQNLFLLCCLFREDADIRLEFLTYFCMGLGIFGDIRELEIARNRMESLIKRLKNRSLLLDSDEENCVRMHDVVRDVCIFIAKREGCIGGNNCTWISSSQDVGEINELLTESRFPNLHLLSLRIPPEEFKSIEGIKFGSAFLEGIKDLYVLCIERYALTSLPHTTLSLINLKTLLLDWCWELKSISVVGKLRNLEVNNLSCMCID